MRFSLLFILLLSGCATRTIYEPVDVPVDRFVQVDRDLVEQCVEVTITHEDAERWRKEWKSTLVAGTYDLTVVKPVTFGDVLVLALLARAALGKCNEQIYAIGILK